MIFQTTDRNTLMWKTARIHTNQDKTSLSWSFLQILDSKLKFAVAFSSIGLLK